MTSGKHSNFGIRAMVSLELWCRELATTLGSQRRDERGAAMVEYGLLLTTALIIAFVVVQLFGQRVLGLFEAVETEFRNVGSAGQPSST